MSDAADWTNNNYGGLGIAVGRVVYVHGSIDPWHALGMTTTEDNDAPAIYIKGILFKYIYLSVKMIDPCLCTRGMRFTVSTYQPATLKVIHTYITSNWINRTVLYRRCEMRPN